MRIFPLIKAYRSPVSYVGLWNISATFVIMGNQGSGDIAMIRTFLLPLLLLFASPAFAEVQVLPNGKTPSGLSPGIAIEGLTPGSTARIHSYALYGRWEPGTAGRWVEKSTVYHAWADVRADRKGRVAMDRFNVGNGTYSGVDGYGLLWSMRKPADPLVANYGAVGTAAPVPKSGNVALLVTQNDNVVASGSFRFTEPEGLTVTDIAERRLHGTYAYTTG